MTDRVEAEIAGSFFIAGAPRCGTTSLSKTLAAHPQVVFSKPKETHYFSRLKQALPREAMCHQFLGRYYAGHDLAGKFIGEGSVSTLYRPQAQRLIQQFDPQARFIISVRNPVEMIASYHSRLLYSLDEDQQDLATAWSLQGQRLQGLDLPPRCREPRLLQYADVASSGKHLAAMFDTVGRENCFVVVFDDLQHRPGELYTDLLSFIGLDDDGRRAFVHKNSYQAYQSYWLQQYVMNPPRWISRLIARRQYASRDSMRFLRGLRRRIKKRNKIKIERPAVSPDLREELSEYFADDVSLLSALLGRDLGHWS